MKRRLFYFSIISFFIGTSLFFWAVNNQTQILMDEIAEEKQHAAEEYQQLLTDYQALRDNYLQQKQGLAYQELDPESATSLLYFTQQTTLAEWQKRAWPFTKEEMFTEIRQMHMADQLAMFPIINDEFRLTNLQILNHKWLLALFISEEQNIHVIFEYGIDAQGQLTISVLDYWRSEIIDYEQYLLSEQDLMVLLAEAINRAIAIDEKATQLPELELLAWLSEVYTLERANTLLAMPYEAVSEAYTSRGEVQAAELIIQQKDHVLYDVQFADGGWQMELVFILDRGWRVNTVLFR